MGTQSWSAVFDHSSDAAFRAWGSDYSAKLALAGLVKTSDTGQINWATVVRAAASTAAGYEIWRFDDALQATAPIYIKIEYGTASNTSVGAMWVTVGTGTNGAGTLTGNVSARTYAAYNGSPGSTVTAYPSYFCHTTGFLGCVFRVGYAAVTAGCFTVVRFSNDDGTPNGDGFSLHVYGLGATVIGHHSVQVVRTAAPATVFAAHTAGNYALWPHSVSGSSVTASGDLQVVPFWAATKQFQQEFAMCGYLNSEVSQGSTFSTTLKGSTARTFIALGGGFGWGGAGPNDGRVAMLWE